MNAPINSTNNALASLWMSSSFLADLIVLNTPDEMARHLCEQLRELTGAKTVAFMEHSDSHEPCHPLYVCPPRRSMLFENGKLATLCPVCNPDPIPLNLSELPPDHALSAPLKEAEFQTLLRIPTHSGGHLVGSFLIADLPDPNRSGEVRSMMEFLGPTIGLAIDNCAARQKIEAQRDTLEAQVEARTAELEAANQELQASRLAALNMMEDALHAKARLEKSDELQRAVIDALHSSTDNLQAFLDQALDEVIRLTESKIGYIYFYDEEQKQFILNSWSKEVMADCKIVNPQTCYELDRTGIWGEAVRQRKPIILNNFKAAHPHKKGLPEEHVELNNFLTVPIFENERIVAVVGVANKLSDYTDQDILTLQLFMDSVWANTRDIHARQAIKESEAQYRDLFDNMTSGFALHEMIYDEEGNPIDYRFLQVNPAFEQLTGLRADDLIGRTVKEALPGTEESWIETYGEVAETGEPIVFEEFSQELNKYFGIRAFRPAPDRFAVIFADITDRKKAEAEIADLARFPEENTNPVLRVSTDGTLLFANAASDALRPLFGANVGERILSEWMNHIQQATREGHPVERELTIAQKTFATTFVPISGRNYINVYARDITERKQLQKAIEKRIVALTRPLEDAGQIEFEELFNLEEIQRIQDEFAKATGVASIITQPDGTPITEPSNFTCLCMDIIRKTEKGCANCFKSDATLGKHKPDGPTIQLCLSGGLWDAGASIEVGGQHIANWLIGQVRDESQTDEHMLAYAKEIGADEAAFMNAFQDVPVMSHEHFEEIAHALFTLANQLSTSAYQNMQQARFIADQKKIEAELRRLSTAIEQSPETVVITDTEGTIQYVNPAFTEVTGYTREEAIGENPRVLKSGEHNDAFYAELWNSLLAGKIWEGRIINKRKDGSLFTEEASFAPVKNPNGKITHFVAVKRDITDELAREEQLQQVQKMEAVGQLAGGIAHDFNNILQAILGFSELLLMTLDKDAEQPRTNVLEIQKAARHAADLTRQLLAFSREQAVEFSPVKLNDIVEGTLSFARSIIGESITVKTDLDPEIHQIKADVRQLERTILNMALNARDAMPQGGELILRTENMSFSAEDARASALIQQGSFVCLSIRDTGTGIPPDVIDHIFEPFFSTKAPGKGTGLGLASIYGIIKKHEGWINVYSEPGRGTTFKIYLPTIHHDAPPEEKKPSRPETGHGERILVVEDDPSVRSSTQSALTSAGYIVTTASNSEEAKILFDNENQHFDLLLSDVILPTQSGPDLAAALLKRKPALKVILCSGHSADRIEHSALDRKNFFFLEKPFSIVTLLKLVDKVFAHRP